MPELAPDLVRCTPAERALLEAGCKPRDFRLTVWNVGEGEVVEVLHLPMGIRGYCGDHGNVQMDKAEAFKRVADRYFDGHLAKPAF